jgi:hypothetical protein
MTAGNGGGDDGNLSNVTIRNNLIWDREDRPASEGYAELLWLQGPQSGTGIITDVYIYNNIFEFPSQNGIGMEQADNVFIYNNTFYGHNSTITANTFHIGISGGSSDITIKNNIFYSLLPYEPNSAGVCIYNNSEQNFTETDADYNLYYRINGRLIEQGYGPDEYYYMADQVEIISDLGWETHGVFSDPLFINVTDPAEIDSLMIDVLSPAVDA